MADLSYTNVIERFFSEALDPILNNYIYNGYTTLSNHLRLPLGLAVVLYITILGLSITQGWVKLSLSNFVKSALKIGLIYTFAMNWGLFSQWGVDGIQLSAGQIGDWLVSATPISLPQFAGPGINGAMQSVFIELTHIGSRTWSMGSWHTIGPYFTAAMIFGFGYSMILIGLFEIVLAKIMLAILFTTAPLFISFTLFKATHAYFDRWLGLIVGYAFLLIFISAVLGLALSFAEWAIRDTYTHHAVGIRLIGFIPTMIVGFISVGIILKVSHLAQSIGGSVSTASGSALVAAGVGGFLGASLGAMQFIKQGKNAGKGIAAMVGKVNGFANQAGAYVGNKAIQGGSLISNAIKHRLRRGGE